MADIKKDAERLVNYVSSLEQQGGLFLSKPQDVIPPTAGLFEKSFPLWEADKEYKKNDLFSYNGCVGYVKQPSLTSQEIYPPFSTGTESLYGARPKPDTDGIYPYVYNMGIFEGMRVKGNDGLSTNLSAAHTKIRRNCFILRKKLLPCLLKRAKKPILMKNTRNGFSRLAHMMLMDSVQR